MNRQDLIEQVAAKAAVSPKQANVILSAAIAAIMDSVSEGQKVTLPGFGSFEPRQRHQRQGRNPQTGAALTIPAKTVPAFAASRPFKTKVASHLKAKSTPNTAQKTAPKIALKTPQKTAQKTAQEAFPKTHISNLRPTPPEQIAKTAIKSKQDYASTPLGRRIKAFTEGVLNFWK